MTIEYKINPQINMIEQDKQEGIDKYEPYDEFINKQRIDRVKAQEECDKDSANYFDKYVANNPAMNEYKVYSLHSQCLFKAARNKATGQWEIASQEELDNLSVENKVVKEATNKNTNENRELELMKAKELLELLLSEQGE